MTRRKIVKAARCTICGHVDRAIIEQTRIAGASLDTIAAKYDVSRDAIFRHMRAHVSDDLRAEYLAGIPLKELADKAAAEGVSVLQHLAIIRSTLMTQFQLAASVGDKNATALLAGRLTEVLREIGRITGEMGSMVANNLTINNVSIMNSPVFATLQANLLHALVPFPEARAAVVAALRQMDENPPATPGLKVIEHAATQRT